MSARSPDVYSMTQRDVGYGSVRGGGSHSLKIKLIEVKDDSKNKGPSVAQSGQEKNKQGPNSKVANEEEISENLMVRIRMKIKAMNMIKEGRY